VVGENDHQVLGMTMVGPEASELIAEGALAMEMCAYAEDVGLTIHTHPTLAEVAARAHLSAGDADAVRVDDATGDRGRLRHRDVPEIDLFAGAGRSLHDPDDGTRERHNSRGRACAATRCRPGWRGTG